MKIAYSWLSQYIDLPEAAADIAQQLTFAGLEVEDISPYEPINGGLAGVVLGEVLSCIPHPNADRLRLTTVDIGGDAPLRIVCGAPNVATGQRVLVATVGTTLYPSTGDPILIKKSKIRGEESEGMICAEDELGLGASHEGIMVLDTDMPNGTPAAEYLHLHTDTILEIGLTPNRADAASHVGIARDLRVILNRDIHLPPLTDYRRHQPPQSLPIRVIVDNPRSCPRYAGVVVAGVRVAESPAWLQHRLRSIGLRPINNVVDITNFVLHELGQPLHAFDYDKIAGQTVWVGNLPAGTPFTTLDGIERKLRAEDLMICDGAHTPMCIGGVFGGAHSGVSEATTNVFLESAYFAPASIRRSAQAHALKTDASFRFERGTDPEGVLRALYRALDLLHQIAGGEVASEVIDHYPQPIAPAQIPVKYAHITRLIGIALPQDEIRRILTQLDISLVEDNNESFIAIVPPYRVDVLREADIIEEIARLYGYENIAFGESLGANYLAEFPSVDGGQLQFNITQQLAAQGFQEMLNNSLTKSAYLPLVPSLSPEDTIEILNPLSEELRVMRRTLLFSGLEVVAYNQNRKQRDLKLFEFGKVYQKVSADAPNSGVVGFAERWQLSLLLSGNRSAESWQLATTEVDFYDLAKAVQGVLQRLNHTELKIEPLTDDIWTQGAVYKIGKQTVARLGAVKKSLLKAFDIKSPVFYAELEWEWLLAQYTAAPRYEEVSKFPEVRRDLSLVLDSQVSFQDIRQLAFQKERKLLKSLNVFDVYEGDKLGTGKKAYAVSFILEDKTATLTDQVIDRVMQKLMQAYEQELGAVIRK